MLITDAEVVMGSRSISSNFRKNLGVLSDRDIVLPAQVCQITELDVIGGVPTLPECCRDAKQKHQQITQHCPLKHRSPFRTQRLVLESTITRAAASRASFHGRR